jgi:hypothetical protein
LVASGTVRDEDGVEIEIVDREENRERKRFAPGDRVVFTQNDRELGVVNGATGRIRSVDASSFETCVVVELDDENERGARRVSIPASFGRFDLAYCLTNHKAQGRTFDSAHVLANPAMCDKEWTYVAASRSRFATTLYVNAAALGLADPERHGPQGPKANRSRAMEALAKRMSRSRAKGTSLDYEKKAEPARPTAISEVARSTVAAFLARAFGRQLAR